MLSNLRRPYLVFAFSFKAYWLCSLFIVKFSTLRVQFHKMGIWGSKEPVCSNFVKIWNIGSYFVDQLCSHKNADHALTEAWLAIRQTFSTRVILAQETLELLERLVTGLKHWQNRWRHKCNLKVAILLGKPPRGWMLFPLKKHNDNLVCTFVLFENLKTPKFSRFHFLDECVDIIWSVVCRVVCLLNLVIQFGYL